MMPEDNPEHIGNLPEHPSNCTCSDCTEECTYCKGLFPRDQGADLPKGWHYESTAFCGDGCRDSYRSEMWGDD